MLSTLSISPHNETEETMSKDLKIANQGRTTRLAQVLEQLAALGVKQREVALELNVPTQYLSDLRHGRRTLSKQFARRLADVYRVSAVWLLHGEGTSDLPNLAAAPVPTAGACLLPVLSAPDHGDPRHSLHWDGGLVSLSGAAAAAAERAKLPFVLRIGADIPSGRLKKNDLVLCSQEPRDDAGIIIVCAKAKAMLAQAAGKARYKTLAKGSSIPGAEPIGYCIGIVWAQL
jgi:hypothetical protein